MGAIKPLSIDATPATPATARPGPRPKVMVVTKTGKNAMVAATGRRGTVPIKGKDKIIAMPHIMAVAVSFLVFSILTALLLFDISPPKVTITNFPDYSTQIKKRQEVFPDTRGMQIF